MRSLKGGSLCPYWLQQDDLRLDRSREWIYKEGTHLLKGEICSADASTLFKEVKVDVTDRLTLSKVRDPTPNGRGSITFKGDPKGVFPIWSRAPSWRSARDSRHEKKPQVN
eukprot:scaffold1483_cov374-Pavlova_lutheri.AAC.2